MAKEGDLAPNSSLTDADCTTVKLAGLRGRKVVLSSYPKDYTPGCSTEASSFRDSYGMFTGRTYMDISHVTFLIDERGSHKKLLGKVGAEGHAREGLEAFTE